MSRSLVVLAVSLALLLIGCSASEDSAPGDVEAPPVATLEPTQEGLAEGGDLEETQEGATGGGMMGGADSGMMDDAAVDAMFIDSMIPHHQEAITMSEQALLQAEHDELRQMAQQIIDDQQREIEQMQSWREEWYPDLEQTMGMQMDNMPMPEDMMLSTDESIPFDLRFIDAMTHHHEGAIMMAQSVVESAEHEELRQMAREIIDKQQAEIDQLQQWRDEWYPDEP